MIVKECPRCGNQFAATNNRRKFCSRTCACSGTQRAWRDPVVYFSNNADVGEDCWIWKGPLNSKGYGSLSVNGKVVGSHRFSWELHNGKIIERMVVCHHCDNPSCVNPDHLFIGSQSVNLRDSAEKGRFLSEKRMRNNIRGEHHPRAKLNADQVRQIRIDRAAKVPGPAIAARYGVSFGLVYAIERRDVWKHVL